MSKSTANVPYSYNTPKFLRHREYGSKRKIGYNDDISVKLYRNIDAYCCDIPSEKQQLDQGGIFNLEFSPEGSLLVAACQNKAVLLFDPMNQRLLTTVKDAHRSCVNCVRFLDANTLATCSDDYTIKLWDTRNMSRSKRTLEGHSNWVKNIEYSEKEKVVVTSAFDGTIYAWDLNSPTENNVLFDKVFMMNGLMRTKLTPDGSKLIVCTTSGYMMVIHDLNLKTLSNDLQTFKPQLYRLMQLSDQIFPAATVFNHLFATNRKRNRIEFIDDFPNDAELISSLQIHPMGWCAVSRNVSEDEYEEWTSVHDIQLRNAADYEDAYTIGEDTASDMDAENHQVHPTDIWMGFESIRDINFRREMNTFSTLEMGTINSGLIDRSSYDQHFQKYPHDRYKIIRNLPRLTHFVSEKNVGKGYIKEQCFSSDGRIICSPYGNGVRLLAFNEKIQELCYCVPSKPQTLFTVAEMENYHQGVVVSCKFSPRQYQMVSGCLEGEVIWYRPIL